ncbi:hypothetical protein SAMN02910456_00102 [Ruminococcaceae bacterium YRB3002]|nr:hypothetical protein SAMN02910456_00102 [Ruminococcaceae bacterium YRB3002]
MSGINDSEIQCECGMHFSGKFCPNCGRKREESSNFTCSCGYTGSVSNFCPNCGLMYLGIKSNASNIARTEEEKAALLQHGWRSREGDFQLAIKGTELSARILSSSGNVDLRIKTTYLPSNDLRYTAVYNKPHPDEEFRVYADRAMIPDKDGITYCSIMKIWYGSGTLHADLLMSEDRSESTVDLEIDDSIVIPDPEPFCGWTCPKCGSRFETDSKCSRCGADIEHFVLFALSEYVSCNPPRSRAIRVYRFDDTKLILEDGEFRRFIPASVLEPAYDIIKEYKIDKWEEYKTLSGVMGGSQSVSYWDGNALVGTSTDYMSGAGGAYYALSGLFTGARLQDN